MTQNNLEMTYYLLVSNFANDVAGPSDLNRFKYKVFSIIWQYGPTWEKKLEIQEKLRDMTEDDIMTGAWQKYNSAANPGDTPTTAIDEKGVLKYIDRQSTAYSTKGKLDGYANLVALLKNDVTNDYLRKFRVCFLQVVQPEIPLYYENADDTKDIDNNVNESLYGNYRQKYFSQIWPTAAGFVTEFKSSPFGGIIK